MKTAISLPDDLFTAADEFAAECGISRSQLYATALREYIGKHSRADLTERINAACARLDSHLPDDMAQATRRKLLEVEW